MPNDNQISAELSAAAVTAVRDAVAVIRTNLPFLVSLSTDERRTLPKLGDNRLALDEDAHALLGGHPDDVPAFVSLPELEKDRTLRAQRGEIKGFRSEWHCRMSCKSLRRASWASHITGRDFRRSRGGGFVGSGVAGVGAHKETSPVRGRGEAGVSVAGERRCSPVGRDRHRPAVGAGGVAVTPATVGLRSGGLGRRSGVR